MNPHFFALETLFSFLPLPASLKMRFAKLKENDWGWGLVTRSPGFLNLFCILPSTPHHLFQWLRDFVLQVNTVVWDEGNRKNKPQFIAPWAGVTWAEFSSVFTTIFQESTNHRASKNSLSSLRTKRKKKKERERDSLVSGWRGKEAESLEDKSPGS